MGIYQRENGIWYAKVTKNKITVRKSLQTTNKKEASLKYGIIREQVLKQIYSSTPTVSIPNSNNVSVDTRLEFDKPTLLKAFNDYQSVCVLQNLAEITLKEKDKLFTILRANNVTWDKINNPYIMELQKNLLKEKARSTVAKSITHLKAFLKWSVKKEYISYQTLQQIDFISAPKQKRKKSIISNAHIKEILNHCEKIGDLDMYFYIITLFVTGSRPNEPIKMTFKDLDFDNSTITIYMNKVKDEKIISVDKSLLNSLTQLLKTSGLDNGCVFLGSIKHKDFYCKKFKKIREELNLPKHYTLYLFRHTAATNIIESTNNIYLAQKLLGHTDIKTTSNHYAVYNPQHPKTATDKLLNSIK